MPPRGAFSDGFVLHSNYDRLRLRELFNFIADLVRIAHKAAQVISHQTLPHLLKSAAKRFTAGYQSEGFTTLRAKNFPCDDSGIEDMMPSIEGWIQ